MDGAFLVFEEKMEFSQAFQDLRDVVAMFGHAPGVDENTINIDKDKTKEILPEHLVHEVLEYRGGVD